MFYINRRVNKKAFFENIDLLQMISAYCQINDPTSTKQSEFDKLISYVKVRQIFIYKNHFIKLI
jgi:hypothetical protein